MDGVFCSINGKSELEKSPYTNGQKLGTNFNHLVNIGLSGSEVIIARRKEKHPSASVPLPK